MQGPKDQYILWFHLQTKTEVMSLLTTNKKSINMDATIQQTISGYTAVFDSFTISDGALQKEIDDFINEFNSLGENSNDVMDFMAKFPGSGLQAQ